MPCIERYSPSRLDRSAIADRVTEYLLQADRRLVILYGQRGSRKSELIRDWVIPRLEGKIAASYIECDPAIPEFATGAGSPQVVETALRDGKMVFLVHADHCLSAVDEKDPAALLAWLQSVEQKCVPGSLVLSVPEQSLSSVLTLQNVAPTLLTNILEIQPISFRSSLLNLTSMTGEADLQYEPEAIDVLDKEVQKRPAIDPIELAQGVDRGFRYFKSEADRCVTRADCAAVGGIAGALDELRHLVFADARDRFGPRAEGQIELILIEAASCSKVARGFDITDLALRLGIESDKLGTMLNWLCDEEVVLRPDRVGGFELVPAELRVVVEQNAPVGRKEISRAEGILRDGVRSWSQLGSALPQKRLDEINAIREWLDATDEQSAVVVRSLLRIGDKESLTHVTYWLHRIRSRSTQISVLLENLFAASPALRQRAAHLLGAYDDREALRQLHRVATEDPDKDVRTVALESLANMNTDEIWPLVAQEACEPNSPYQVHAVACLRLFKDERAWKLLRDLVCGKDYSPEVKEEAISTLAQLRTAESVKILVQVGLFDADAKIRCLTAAALGTLGSPELAREAVNEVRRSSTSPSTAAPRTFGSLLRGLWQVVEGFAITAGNIAIQGLALLVLRRFKAGFTLFGIEVALFAVRAALPDDVSWWVIPLLVLNWLASQLVATRASYAWLKSHERDARPAPPADKGPKSKTVLSLFCWLLALDVIPILLLHGVVHLLAGRLMRSLKLFTLECAGLLCCFASYYYFTTQVTWITPFPHSISRVLFFAYLAVGVGLFLYTLAMDVIPLLVEVFQYQSGRRGRQRKLDLFRCLAANPFAAQYLLQSAEAGDEDDQRWARKVVRLTARYMPYKEVIEAIASQGENPSYLIRGLAPVTDKDLLKAAAEAMKRSEPRVQRRIIDLLACRPTEVSLAELRPLRRSAGWYGRFRYSAGVWYHRLRVWPSSILFVSVLILPFPILAAVEIVKTSKDPDRPVMRMVETERGRNKLSDDQLLEALQFLAKFDQKTRANDLQQLFDRSTAGQRPIWTGNPTRIAIEVCTLPVDTGDKTQTMKVNLWRQQLFTVLIRNLQSNATDWAEAVTTIKNRADRCGMPEDSKEAFVSAASSMLTSKSSNDQISLAVVALDVAGTRSAVDPLKKTLALLVQPADARTAVPSEQLRRDQLRRNVISALAANDSDEADTVLQTIAEQGSKSSEIAKFALAQLTERTVRRKALILDDVRTPLMNNENDTAYTRAAEFLASHPKSPFRDDILDLQASAAYNLALSSDDSGQWATKAIDAFEHTRNTSKWSPESAQKLSVAYQLRAEARGKASQFDSGLSDARLAIAADPKSAFAKDVAAWILQRQGRMQESVPYVREAIETDPTTGYSYSLLYESYVGRIDKSSSAEARTALVAAAIADFRNLIDRNPKVIWPRETLANLLHDRVFDFEGSYRMCLELQDLRSSLSDADRFNLDANFTEARFTVGRYQDVVDSARQLDGQLAQNDYDTRVPMRVYVYMGLLETGDMDGARAAWTRLLELINEVPPTYDLTWRYDGSIRYLRLQKDSSPMHQSLLDLLESMNDLSKSRHLPQKVISETEAVLHLTQTSAAHS